MGTIQRSMGVNNLFGLLPAIEQCMSQVTGGDPGPDQTPGCPNQGIRPIQYIPSRSAWYKKSFFEYFLMQARTIKTSRQREFDIVFQGFIARCSQNSIRIISLIEDQPLEDWFSIYKYLVSV